MNPSRGISGAVLLAVLAGCTLDFSTENAVSPDDIPLLVMEDFSQTTVREGRELYSVQGARAENYNTRQEVRLKQFRFQEYDSAGQVVSEGEAESAIIQTATNDAAVLGTLKARSSKEGVALSVVGGESGGVDWNNNEKVLQTRPGSRVNLQKDDGSQITAQAMTLNLKTNQLSLDTAVTGVWKTDQKTDDVENPGEKPAAAPDLPAGGP